ncbi:Protein similar to glutamate synthase [NADPH] small chain, clustered with sulfite reductase [hydrothermal vent metagenome]|uniref:Protein similar to glutamate synthase [NADPH] small chain, clustered with sulfite reductase n=1 Tax=hydrothermal vent metagenome TaxID=652676 RepID=A0A3B0Y9I9_9ZZZZ
MDTKRHTFRRYKDGDTTHLPWQEEIIEQDTSYKCPTYIHRTPPCQGSCPSGEDIRGWLDIVRGMEKPPSDLTWQEYAFRRSTDANPFPAVMGRVCPAPCQDGCNRNEVEGFVGINSVEQFIGDYALEKNYGLGSAGKETGKKVAIIGGGVAGLACAYQLRRRGHGCTIFEEHEKLGGMMRYGIPGYRTPREVLDGEIQRIVDMGVDIQLNTRIGTDISVEQLEQDYDAVFIAIGAQSGRPLPIPNAGAPNCITGVAFLDAFNQGRLKYTAEKVVVVGGGDTAMDVVSVARRLGHIETTHEKDRTEFIVLGHTAHDVASAARRQGADVLLAYRRPIEKMPAARHEVEAAMREGVRIRGSLAPKEVVLGEDGRATALRVEEVEWIDGEMKSLGKFHDLECDLIVAAVGQGGNLEGLESFDNGRGLISPDKTYQIPDKPGYFVAGDIIKPHLLTTAIGQARIAAEAIDHYLNHEHIDKRPNVDVNHFNLLNKLREWHLEPEDYASEVDWGTDHADYAMHNYEDRSRQEIIPADKLFLGHFEFTPCHQRQESGVDADEVLGHYEERFSGLPEAEVVAEAKRCMSCGMCFECDNCVIYCPQDAVKRTPPEQSTTGRYVYTDYDRCIGCHICSEVCPTGYINMGLGDGAEL